MEYLPWCVTALRDYMPEIVHAALLGQQIEVAGGNAEQTEDLQRFCSELSPHSLLHHPADSLRPLLDAEDAAFVAAPPPAILTIVDGIVVAGKGLEPTESAVCKRWANAMVSASSDTTALKMILQNNGRKVTTLAFTRCTRHHHHHHHHHHHIYPLPVLFQRRCLDSPTNTLSNLPPGLVSYTHIFSAVLLPLLLNSHWHTARLLRARHTQVIQEVNRIKWLLGMAETNHYALYNAQRYLSKCDTPPR
jgi:hypothetical protein